MKRIAVLLSGNGVYDGSEIHETVFTMLSIAENGGEYQCIAPDIDQHHVVNHVNGEAMPDKRNVFVEAARIARGNILKVSEVNTRTYDALVLPGGFGVAKNFTKWAFKGPDGEINSQIKDLIQKFNKENKPIVALCMAPTVLAKAFENSDVHAEMTVGSVNEISPYDIAAISEGMKNTGVQVEMKTVNQISYDKENKIISAPCYMMEASIIDVRENVKQSINKLFEII